MKFKKFTYQFDAGPLATLDELEDDWQVGNCRRMVQWYYFINRNVFLTPDQILCPQAYCQTGQFVFEKDQKIDWSKLEEGDIIYAERIRSKDGKLVNKTEETFSSPEDYIISLHTALFIEGDSEILHATAIAGESCVWPLEKFNHFYRPVAVKRIERSVV